MTIVVPVDANALVLSVSLREPNHQRVIEVLSSRQYELVIPALCVAEASYLVAKSHGPLVEARFLAGLAAFEVIAPEPDDWERIAELVRQYADFPLGGTDASIVALAERLGTDTILTLDRRHFGAIRPRHCEAFRLLPEL